MTGKRSTSPAQRQPSEKEVLEFIRKQPSHVGKRDIARAFGLTGTGKIAIKALLKKLEQDGKLARNRRKITFADALPAVVLAEVTGITRDGDCYGTPVEWDEAEQGKPPSILITARAGQVPGKGDHVLLRLEAQHQSRGRQAYHGKVIRRLSDERNRSLGVFRLVRGRGARLIPTDKKARSDLQILPQDTGGAEDGELVEVEITRRRGAGLPQARVRKRLGDVNDQRNISLIAIHHHGLPVEFPEAVLAETEKLRTFSRDGREDFRSLPLITIDPADARDHDDAVWAAPDEDAANRGGFRVIVAIADVAAYVRPQSALDREARFRGNSVYFPDRVVPMLPERISNDLCSLREKEERPAFACLMSFDALGRKLRHSFKRITMRSAAKLSYQEAQEAIDGRPNEKTSSLLEPVLNPLWSAYKALAKARDKRGPLDLDLPERKLILNDRGEVAQITVPPRLEAHRLIEEFMIQANVCAAETLEERNSPLLYRVHEPPTEAKLRGLADALRSINEPFSLGQVVKPQLFNNLLARMKGSEHASMLAELVLRTQSQALYAPKNKGHFGLALRRYAHFTSPIRRYADLIVHRGLISALAFGPDGLSPTDIAQLGDTADLISDAERRAMAAERETTDRLIAAHLATHIGVVFKGNITGVVGAGLFVKLAISGADGFVPVRSLGTSYFQYDEREHSLLGEASGQRFRLGDEVEVRLMEAVPVSGGLRFDMVSGGSTVKSKRRPARQGRRRR